jgi:hypothetical protein
VDGRRLPGGRESSTASPSSTSTCSSPRHGEVGGRSDLADFRAYLADIVAAAEEHGAGAPIPEGYRDWAFEDGWTRNLAFLTGRR